MGRRYLGLLVVVMILCASVIIMIVVTVLNYINNATNEFNIESSNQTLRLDEAIEMLKKKYAKVFGCVEKKSCDLYIIDVGIIVTPANDNLYTVSMFFDGSNYTRGSVYRDTFVWRAEFIRLSYHISMIDYGVSTGYKEWLNIEKRLGIHLDVGYGIYDRSRDTLLVHIDLPTFNFCEIAHPCGQFYLNATMYIDNEKYIVYQYTKLNFSYLIDRGYVRIRDRENGYAYPINPPAILRYRYVDSPYWRIPVEFLEKNTSTPIIAVVHIATTNRSVLEKYLNKLEIFRPLIEANLMIPYISEITNDDPSKFQGMLGRMNARAIQEFLECLRSKVVERLYPGIQMDIEYISNPHGGDYYIAKWNNTTLKAYIGTLNMYIYNTPWTLAETLIKQLIQSIDDCM